MTHSINTIAAVRFGYGFGEQAKDVTDLRDLALQLDGPDVVKQDYPTLPSSRAFDLLRRRRDANILARQNDADALALQQDLQKTLATEINQSQRNIIARATFSSNGFRERLVQFWTNHFTVSQKNLVVGSMIPSFIDEAIRPNILGDFSELLTACTLHPAMLTYLDQVISVGPNSPVGMRQSKGLNENLARELLELHTLGAEGDYTQKDVRQLAKLLTGVRTQGFGDMVFRERVAEPGAETVLGKSYGGGRATLDDVKQFLVDVSKRPDTAKHIARKLVVHFISDQPDEDQIQAVEQRFYTSGGNLRATYETLLDHPISQSDVGQKVKQPFDFVVSGLRALRVQSTDLDDYDRIKFRRTFGLPLQLMGQKMFSANGPDGWPEHAEAWITPVGLAGRLQWAMQAAMPYANRLDPKTFMREALGELATSALNLAVIRAESKQEALAIVMASPEFNRR